MKKKVLIIDNYDSFTYILKQYFGELGADVEVFKNDEISIGKIRKINPTHIVLSPGPGNVDTKKDVGIMFDVIDEFHKTKPLLGVCLGHQALAKYFGGRSKKAQIIMHGKRSDIFHHNRGVLKGVRNPFTAMRYHSLIIDTSFTLNPNMDVVAHTDDNLVMAIMHRKYPVFGVQFHPESLGTEYGIKIIKNFLTY